MSRRRLRKDLHCIHPDRINLDEFMKQLGDNSAFADNMRFIPYMSGRTAYIEDWMETFARWHDVKFDARETTIEELCNLVDEMSLSRNRTDKEIGVLIEAWVKLQEIKLQNSLV